MRLVEENSCEIVTHKPTNIMGGLVEWKDRKQPRSRTKNILETKM